MEDLELLQTDVEMLQQENVIRENELIVESLTHSADVIEKLHTSLESGEISLENAAVVATHAFDGVDIGLDEDSTEVTLEKFVDNLKKLWASIVKALRRAWDAFSAFLSKLFGGVAKAKKLVGELKDKFKSGDNYVQKLESKQVASMLAIDGEYNSQAIFTGFTNAGNVQATLNNFPEAIENAYANIAKTVADRKKSTAGLSTQIANYLPGRSSLTNTLVGYPLPGNYYLNTVKKGSWVSVMAAYVVGSMGRDSDVAQLPEVGIIHHDNTSSRLKEYAGKGEFSDKISGDICLKWIDALNAILDGIEGAKKSIEDMGKQRDELMSKVTDIIDASDRGLIAEPIAKAEVKILNGLMGMRLSKSVSTSNAYLFRYSRNSISFLNGLEVAA